MESVMPSSNLILCRLLLLLPSIFPSIRVFSSESVLRIRWPKYWSFSPSNEYSGLISFRIDWFDLAVQGTLKSSPTPQFKSINSLAHSFLYGPTFISIHDYGKIIALTIMDFCWQSISLFFSKLSRFAIAFLPRSKHLLISGLQSSSAVILEPTQNKVSHSFYCFPISLSWRVGSRCLNFWMLSFKQIFHSPLLLSSRGSLAPLQFLP